MTYKIEKIAYGMHESEFLDLYTPETIASKLLIIFVHGGFFKKKYDYSLMNPLADDFAKRGHRVVNIEYPRVGEGLCCLEMIESVFRSYDYLDKILPGIPRVIIGHSAGGYYGLLLGMDYRFENLPQEFTPPHMIIALAPITNLWKAKEDHLSIDDKGGDATESFVNSKREVEARQENYEWISPVSHSVGCSMYVIHGYADKDVPIGQSIEYRTKLMHHNNANFFLEENIDHYDVINPKHPIWELIRNIIR